MHHFRPLSISPTKSQGSSPDLHHQTASELLFLYKAKISSSLLKRNLFLLFCIRFALPFKLSKISWKSAFLRRTERCIVQQATWSHACLKVARTLNTNIPVLAGPRASRILSNSSILGRFPRYIYFGANIVQLHYFFSQLVQF